MAGVPGIELDPDSLPLNRLAPSLATFLSVLHTFSTDHATGLGVAHQDADGCLAEAKADALEDFEYVTRAAPDLVVPGWVELLSEAPAGPAESHRTDCLVHGDLAAEHILYGSATRSLTGVIDWSEVSIGDPSVDLAAAFHWGGTRFLDMVLSTYRGPADDGARDRARYRAACRGIGDIVFGIELERAEYVAAGVRALNFSLAR